MRDTLTKVHPLLISLITLLLVGCTAGNSGLIERGIAGAVVSADSLPAPDTSYSNLVAQPDYRIGPLDQLEISVFEMPDFERNVRVNASGQISLPLAGTLAAAGKTTLELESDIASVLTEDYLNRAQVSIFVIEFASQRVTVDGAVGTPGIYPLTGRTTLMQAIALGGGLNELADPSGVTIFREVNNQKMAGVFDVAAIRSGEKEDPEVFGNDLVVVDFSGARSAWRDFRTTAPFFTLFYIF
jgi:polysaccharide export outer membrane protein